MKNNRSLETYFERMRDLSGIKENKKNPYTNNNVTLVEHKKANDGTILGIVKDAHNYYIKKTTSKDKNLNESHFVFISGLENKNEYKYPSLSDAQKHLNIFINSMNENFSKKQKTIERKKENLNEDNKYKENPDVWIKNMIKEGKKEEEINRYNSFKKRMSLNENKTINEDNENNEIDDTLQKTSDALENLDDKIENLNNDDSKEGKNDMVNNDSEKNNDDLDLDDIDLDDDEENKEENLNDGEENKEEDLNDDEENKEEDLNDDEENKEEDLDDDESSEELDVKEIEKIIGKLTYKIRNLDLTPNQTKSFMNSLLSAFESNLSEIDLEDRKKMSNKILKAEQDDEQVNENNNTNTNFEEKEEDLEECNECETFESYLFDRGYGDINGVSSMEMANVISGYIDQKDKLSNKDLFEIAQYCSEDVVSELSEYGYTNEINELKPYIKKINENNKMKFGSFQADFNPDDINVGNDDENLNENEEENELSGELDSTATSLDNDTDITNRTQMAPAADTMGVTSPSRNELNVDLKSGHATLTVSEQKEIKLRKYIRNRIEEKLGNKKPLIDENKKSLKIKKLDNLIDKTLFKLTK